MKPRERVWAALRGEAVDRPPISFWGHFYDRESSAEDLVAATVDAHRAYGWDWIKLNPRKHYHVEPWGVRYQYRPGVNVKPVLTDWPVRKPEDWAAITERPPDAGALGEQLEAVRLLRARLPDDVPFVQTVFTPFAILGELVEPPGVLRDHVQRAPGAVRPALEAVTVTFERYVREVLRAGADGIFLATTDWASRDLMEPETYRAWARPGDLRMLAAAADAPFNVLHVCKRHNMLAEVADYPVAAFSWAATDPTNPSLADGLRLVKGAVMGGIDQERALQQDDPSAVLEEFKRGLEQTDGRRWLVAPGCSIPPDSPVINLRALRDAVGAPRAPTGRPG
jgi:uroporphyrinogen decarboxylase